MDIKSVPRSSEVSQPFYQSHTVAQPLKNHTSIPDSSDIQFINCITGDNLFDQFDLPDMDLAEILDHW